MCKRFQLLLVHLTIVLLCTFHTVTACYVIAAGKKATADGSVIFGHVEQNYTDCVLNFRYIPKRTYGPNTSITLYRGGKLAQVTETNALLWTQNIKQEFADGFMNEWGVGIYTNLCNAKENRPQLTDGGIGFLLRRLVAERAKTARQGVHVAASLVEKFGYAAPTGRTLTIADPNEIWLVALCKGKHWLARRVPDDQAIAMPNTFIIRDVNLADTMNFLASDNLIEYAKSRGWYSSGTFIFTNVYGTGYNSSEYDRQWKGQKALTRSVVPHGNTMPFSVKPDRKLTVANVAAILREHDNYATQEITVYQLRNQSMREIDCIFWRTTAQGKYSALTPWYAGITKTPEYYCKKVSVEQQLTLDYHFKPPQGTFSQDPNLIWWEYLGLQKRVQNSAKGQQRVIQVWEEFESRTFGRQPHYEVDMRKMYPTQKDSVRSMLTTLCNHRAHTAATLANKMNKSWITNNSSNYCVALATAYPLTGTQPHTVLFDGFSCSNERISSKTWDMGNGTTYNNAIPVYTYRDTGTFYATYTVRTSQNAIDIDTVIIKVKPGAVHNNNFKKITSAVNRKDCHIHFDNASQSIMIEWNRSTSVQSPTFALYSLKGSRVFELTLGSISKGKHSIAWYGDNHLDRKISSGTYVAVLMVDRNRIIKAPIHISN